MLADGRFFSELAYNSNYTSLYICHTRPLCVVPSPRTRCIKSQMRKIYSSTVKCPKTSKTSHYKTAYTSKAFCSLESGEHNAIWRQFPLDMSGAPSRAFPLVGLAPPPTRVPPYRRFLNKAPLTVSVIFFFPFQWLLKVESLSHQFLVVNPRLFVLEWLSALHVVFRGRIPFKMIPNPWENSHILTLLSVDTHFSLSLLYGLKPKLWEEYIKPSTRFPWNSSYLLYKDDTCSRQWNMGENVCIF